jgi:3,4-dihydroxy 2-butanone 4-phosphate synthase / GTP cyclohydrolase II
MSAFASIEAAVEEIAAGRMVVVVDDEDRENEGDLIMAADAVTPEAINFMATHARGLICVALPEERLAALALPRMVADATALHETAFTVSVDLANGGTGISAHDRSDTIRALCDERTRPDDLARPGHVFPLAVRPGGVLARAGHTEAAHDLAAMAGRAPAGVLVEVMSADGTMARRPELERFAAEHRLLMISVAQLIAHRRAAAATVARTAAAALPTTAGPGTIKTYTSIGSPAREIVAIVTGDLGDGEHVLTRLHSECLTGDVLGSTRCDCGDQLREAQALIAAEGRGVLLYVRGDEGRGIGLTHKVRAYALQDQGHDTVDANVALGFPADARTYDAAAAVLHDLGVRSVALLTNNPDKCEGLQQGGIAVTSRVALGGHANPDNLRYLATKRDRMGHLISA